MDGKIDKELIQDDRVRTTDILAGPPVDIPEDDDETEDGTDVFEKVPVEKHECPQCGEEVTIEDGVCPFCIMYLDNGSE